MFHFLATPLAALLEAAAESAEKEPGSNILYPLLAMGAIFYFVLIAPDRKQRKQRQALLDQLKKGDEVMTTGGMIGKVVEAREDRITLQVADNTRLCFSRQAVQTVLSDPKSDEQTIEKTRKKETH